MKKNETIELITYFMFFTGLLLWSKIDLPWEYFKINQFIHVIFSSLICILLLLPFMKSHVKEHKKTIIKRKKSYKKRQQTFFGILIAITLLILLISGSYLFLFGNRGGDIYGIVSNFLHFYLSYLFVFLIVYHSYYLGRKGAKKDKDKIEKLFKKKEKIQC